MSEIFKSIEIEINHGCNKACSYCPNSNSNRIETGFMSESLYQTLINQLEVINYSGKISFSFYNEPTLSPDLEKFITIAKAQLPGSTTELYSNGILLSLQKYQSLLKSGLDKFIITKHEDVLDYEFEKTLKFLSAQEKEHLEYRHYTELNLTNRGGILKHIKPEIRTTFLQCLIPQKMLTVTVKGNIVPCFEDFHQKNQMGNILKDNILNIWNSARYVDFRSELKKGMRHKFEACRDCNRLEVL